MSSVAAVRWRRALRIVAEARGEARRVAAGPQRFAWFASAGVAITSIPYLWVLWDLFTGSVDPLRSVRSYGTFYDLQAKAMLAGHLWLPKGAIGIEAFVHDGREYTYFGIFPSLIRIPFLLLAPSLDGRMTAPSILVAWLVTGLFSALLVWRVRVLGRGDIALGRGEASALGILVASITGGSALVYLAATPWVYDEDFAWSVALTVASLFALVGVLERPSRRRFVGAGVAVLLTSLDRAPPAYGCEIAAIGIAIWFATRRGDPRRWTLAASALAVGLIPLVVAGAVNTAKFGSPFALPMASQVWTSVNAHRRAFLAANGGRAFSLRFLPSTLAAYMNPAGLSFSSVFPYIAMPTTPAQAVAGAVLDQTYPTAAIPASMPLLFLLGCWGVVTQVRRRPAGRLHLARLPLLGAAAGCAGVLLWGYIAGRYLADFIPFLLLASAVGLIDIWRRLAQRPRRVRGAAVAVFAVLGVFGVVANTLVSMTPERDAWSSTQVGNYVSLQNDLSNITGHPLSGLVVRADRLPFFAPEGTFYDLNNCSGLYLSTGYSYATVPAQQFEHTTWMPVEQGGSIVTRLTLVFEPVAAGMRSWFTLIQSGDSTVLARVAWVKRGTFGIRFDESDPHHPAPGGLLAAGTVKVAIAADLLRARPKTPYRVELIADPYLNQLSLLFNGKTFLFGPFTAAGSLRLSLARVDGRALVAESLVGGTQATPLCSSLTGGGS
jgi:hypothetical protein